MKAPMNGISWFSINRSLKGPMTQYLYAKKTTDNIRQKDLELIWIKNKAIIL